MLAVMQMAFRPLKSLGSGDAALTEDSEVLLARARSCVSTLGITLPKKFGLIVGISSAEQSTATSGGSSRQSTATSGGGLEEQAIAPCNIFF